MSGSVAVPDVSVVMGVYNGRNSIDRTISSVLSQSGISFEFIVVDDGSTDGSSAILRKYEACDNRVRVLRQSNQGLTRALVAGCGLARGRYIARQDCGDVSLQGRLAELASCLDANPDTLMVSCGTRFLGPLGEELFTVNQSSEVLMRGLLASDPEALRGPSHHGSTMFRRDAYEKVGGYRSEFRVAQDLDLWTRLAEVGRCVAIDATLYEARLEAGSISAARREEQVEATRVIADCIRQRRNGASDLVVLEKWLQTSRRQAPRRKRSKASTDASFYYFIGSILQDRQPAASRNYFQRALLASPFHVRSLAKLVLSIVRMK